jgi:hypothetical protein
MLIITTLRGIDLLPMNHFFLAAAFFSFHSDRLLIESQIQASSNWVGLVFDRIYMIDQDLQD